MTVKENETFRIHTFCYYLDNDKKEKEIKRDDAFYMTAIHSFKYVSIFSYRHENMLNNEFYKIIIFSDDDNVQEIHDIIYDVTDNLDNCLESECSFKCVLNPFYTLNL